MVQNQLRCDDCKGNRTGRSSPLASFGGSVMYRFTLNVSSTSQGMGEDRHQML